MHPAPSIVVFTTLSGAGLGLAAAVGLGMLGGGAAMVGGAVVAICLTGGGLVASVFHLRRPDRAWRALSQWRSSWLSREGILAPAALALLAVYAAVGWVFGTPPPLIGMLCTLTSITAVYATGMIYAQLRAVPAWHGWLTAACFLLFAAAGGLLLVGFMAAVAGDSIRSHISAAIIAIVAAWTAKYAWWQRLDRAGMGESTVASATGIKGADSIRQLETPHTGDNYLTKEMGFEVARRHASILRPIALAVGGVLPTALAAISFMAVPVAALGAAAALHLAGVAVSRWLFFAEAKHVVSLYYRTGA